MSAADARLIEERTVDMAAEVSETEIVHHPGDVPGICRAEDGLLDERRIVGDMGCDRPGGML